jgi:SAM-dependent methyltransferase
MIRWPAAASSPSLGPSAAGRARAIERRARAAAAFGRFLRECGYLEDVRALTGDAGGAALRPLLRALSGAPLPARFGGEQAARLELLILGRPVDAARARQALGEHLELLLEIGWLEVEGRLLRSDRYALVGVRGRPFVISRLRHARSAAGSIAAYLGRDTEELYDWAARTPGRRVLDLGCGAGVVGVLLRAGDPGREVVGVDLCGEAVAVAGVNAALNDTPYVALEGDLYESVQGRTFDLVVADPPAVPLPEDLGFPVYGSGGVEGWQLLARIVGEVERVLAPGGRLLAITELQCAAGEPSFYAWLEGWSGRSPGRRARMEVVESRLLPADYYRSLGANLRYLPGAPWPESEAARQAERLASFARDRDLRFGHWVCVEVECGTAAASSCALTWRHGRPAPSSRPRLVTTAAEAAERLGRVYRHSIDEFGPWLTGFVEQADGSRDLRAIAARLRGDALPYLTDLTSALSQLGLVQVDARRRPADAAIVEGTV